MSLNLKKGAPFLFPVPSSSTEPTCAACHLTYQAPTDQWSGSKKKKVKREQTEDWCLGLTSSSPTTKGPLKSKPKKWSVHAHFCIWLCALAKGHAYPVKVIGLTEYWRIIKTQDSMNATLQKWMIVKSRMNLNKWASGRCSSTSNGIIFQRGDSIAINTCINPCIKTALPLMVLKWQWHGDKAITLKP